MATQTYSWADPSGVKPQGYPASKSQTQDEPWVGTPSSPKQSFPAGKNPNAQTYFWPEVSSTAKQDYPASNRHADMEDPAPALALALAEVASHSQYRQDYGMKDTDTAHAGGGNFSYAMGLAHRSAGSQASTFPESLSAHPTEAHQDPALSLAAAIAGRQGGKGFGPK